MNEFSTTNEILLEFATKIKNERLKRNITQEEMAAKVGVSLSTYKIFEKSGKGSFEHFINILKAFGKISELNNLFVQSDFSPKEKALGDTEKKTKRQRASSQMHKIETTENTEHEVQTLSSLIEQIKAKNESKH
ncbi:helix-turn-helix domain-containing protein [Sulfurimonas sp.]|uniref:helix-turn-helix domain-containing protein n=1 Tax=Sulfurimonas sp. TaxID=2022749 RepID=UPI003D0D8499